MPRAERLPAFADGKAPDALRTIGEVESALGIKAHVLRYWEEHIPALKPLKRAGGRRLYRPEDIAVLLRIDELINRQGYTLRGAKTALGQRGARALPLDSEDQSTPPSPNRELAVRMRSLRADLAEILEDLSR